MPDAAGLKLQKRGKPLNAEQPPFSNFPHTGHRGRNNMESPLASNIFRRLLSHQTCSKLRFCSPTSGRLIVNALGRRYYRNSKEDDGDDDSRQTSDWQMRTDLFPPDKLRDYERYPMVTSDMLRSRRERPKRVKMLARDFIEGSVLHWTYPTDAYWRSRQPL